MKRVPETDDHEYRNVVLDNGLRALVVCDPQADTASASMTVGVGSFCDPPHVQGLAHFCEHMCFLGSAKYPSESEFASFVSAHGGSHNAATGQEETQYYFEVVPAALSKALDIFAQFFVAPLFTESATERELHAVDSEHARNLQSDDRRESRVVCEAAAAAAHPLRKFSTGSLATLGAVPPDQLRVELLAFHARYYVPSAMTLAVVGRQSADELEALVRELFSRVPVRKQQEQEERPASWKEPFEGEGARLGIRLSVVPVRDEKWLRILWPLPELISCWKGKPYHHLAHLLGHESDGSVLAALKRRHWANSLVAGVHRSARDFSLFEATVELTDEGFANREHVALCIFQYIEMLRRNVPQRWIHDELSTQRALEFRFLPKVRPLALCSLLSPSMQIYPTEDLLAALYVIDEYDPDGIKKLLSLLTPQRCIVVQKAKDFESSATIAEKWYGTRYSLEPLQEASLKLWADPSANEELHLPPPNPFLPSIVAIKAPASTRTPPPGEEYPREVLRTERLLCYHKQDYTFRVPKALARLLFVTPVSAMSARDEACSTMLVDLIDEELNKFSYLADVAGLRYSLKRTWRGVLLKIGGFDQKLSELATRIVREIFAGQFTEERFEVIKESYLRRLAAWTKAQPTAHAGAELRNLVLSPNFVAAERAKEAETVSHDEMIWFAKSRIWSCGTKILVHVQGNITEEEARAFCREVEAAIPPAVKPLPTSHFPELRTAEVPVGCEVRHSREVNPENVNSAVFDFFQVGPIASPPNKDEALLDLLAHVIKEPCFNVLRTQEQLGYAVWSYKRRMGDTFAFCVLVQSAKFSADHVEARIEAFLSSFRETLRAMPEEEFVRNKTSLIEKILERDTSLSTEVQRFWPKTRRGTFDWDSAQQLAALIKDTTRQEVAEFFDRIAINQGSRRKLAVLLHSEAQPITPGTAEIPLGTGSFTFRRRLPMLPSRNIFLF